MAKANERNAEKKYILKYMQMYTTMIKMFIITILFNLAMCVCVCTHRDVHVHKHTHTYIYIIRVDFLWICIHTTLYGKVQYLNTDTLSPHISVHIKTIILWWFWVSILHIQMYIKWPKSM